MSDLPVYRSTRNCPKCGNVSIDISYRAGRPHLAWADGMVVETTTHGPTGGDCLLRTCNGCGWAWLEACADQSQAGRPMDSTG